MIQTIGIGTHVIANLVGCSPSLLDKVPIVQKILNEVVKEAKLTKVGETFYQFQPQGVTGIILLAESHISIHTWPENGTAAVDIFTCGDEGNADNAFEILLKKFNPKDHVKQKVNR